MRSINVSTEELVRIQFQKYLNASKRFNVTPNYSLDLDCDLAKRGTIVSPEVCIARISTTQHRDGSYYHVTSNGVLFEDARGGAERLFSFDEVKFAGAFFPDWAYKSAVHGKDVRAALDIVIEKKSGEKIRLDSLGAGFEPLMKTLLFNGLRKTD